MANKYTDLEKALSTLVTKFHGASATKSSTLKSDEFQNLLSSQLPNLFKTAGTDQGMKEVFKQMGVADGEGVTFKNFWNLIQSVATSQFGNMSKEKVAKCGCLLQ